MCAKKKQVNKLRVIFSVLYLLLGILLIFLFRKEMFYLEPKVDTYNIYRFLWCLSASFFGFAGIAFHVRHIDSSPWPSYVTYYPWFLLVISTLSFSLFHLFSITSGFVFYYISFSLCVLLSYWVDSFWTIVGGLVSRNKSMWKVSND